MSMTNLSAQEINLLFSKVHDHLYSEWNVGRGRRWKYKPQDVLFMTLTTLKHGGSWDFLGKMFRIKGPTFERLATGFIEVLAPHAVEMFVSVVSRESSYSAMRGKNVRFSNFPYAVEAIDVTFQQANRPSGNVQEGKVYYSGKHSLYGFKVDMCVRANGLCSDFSKHYPGSYLDIEIMRKRITIHRSRLRKRGNDLNIEDTWDMSDKFPNMWGAIMDKGYQGASENIRAITLFKKPARGILNADQEAFNRKLSADRILVENYFGWMMSWWHIMSRKYTWSEEKYDMILGLCVSFTNFLIESHPLRASDGVWYNRYLNRLQEVADTRVTNRNRTQARYRDNRKRRLEQAFCATPASDDETIEDSAA